MFPHLRPLTEYRPWRILAVRPDRPRNYVTADGGLTDDLDESSTYCSQKEAELAAALYMLQQGE